MNNLVIALSVMAIGIAAMPWRMTIPSDDEQASLDLPGVERAARVARGVGAVAPITSFTLRIAQNQVINDDQVWLRAEELIKQARAAIGGEAILRNILTLSTSGKSRRFVKYVSVQSPKKVVEEEKTLDGAVELDFAFPDKFRRRVKTQTLNGFGYSYTEIINSNDAWRDPPLRPTSSQNDRRLIDVSDVQRTELMLAQGARQQLTFYLFGWLLQPLPSFPLELRYGGQTTIRLGKADVITAEGKGGFSFLLLLDSETHLPLVMAVPFIESRPPIIKVDAAGFSWRFMKETYDRMRQERQARATPPYPRELQLHFSDHRVVDGVLLPHRITRMIDNAIEEEVSFDEIRINRQMNLKKFAEPPKLKD